MGKGFLSMSFVGETVPFSDVTAFQDPLKPKDCSNKELYTVGLKITGCNFTRIIQRLPHLLFSVCVCVCGLLAC